MQKGIQGERVASPSLHPQRPSTWLTPTGPQYVLIEQATYTELPGGRAASARQERDAPLSLFPGIWPAALGNLLVFDEYL